MSLTLTPGALSNSLNPPSEITSNTAKLVTTFLTQATPVKGKQHFFNSLESPFLFRTIFKCPARIKTFTNLTIVKTLILSTLIFLPALIGGQEAKASLYNPYESYYKEWNRDNGRYLERYNPYKNYYNYYKNDFYL